MKIIRGGASVSAIFSAIANWFGPKPITISQLKDLATNSGILVGRWYEITDYQAIFGYLDPDPNSLTYGQEILSYGPNEVIRVQGLSSSLINEKTAYSTQYPRDEIHFSLEDILQDNGGCRSRNTQGCIYYRHDPLSYNTFSFDYRADAAQCTWIDLPSNIYPGTYLQQWDGSNDWDAQGLLPPKTFKYFKTLSNMSECSCTPHYGIGITDPVDPNHPKSEGWVNNLTLPVLRLWADELYKITLHRGTDEKILHCDLVYEEGVNDPTYIRNTELGCCSRVKLFTRTGYMQGINVGNGIDTTQVTQGSIFEIHINSAFFPILRADDSGVENLTVHPGYSNHVSGDIHGPLSNRVFGPSGCQYKNAEKVMLVNPDVNNPDYWEQLLDDVSDPSTRTYNYIGPLEVIEGREYIVYVDRDFTFDPRPHSVILGGTQDDVILLDNYRILGRYWHEIVAGPSGGLSVILNLGPAPGDGTTLNGIHLYALKDWQLPQDFPKVELGV